MIDNFYHQDYMLISYRYKILTSFGKEYSVR